MSLHYDVKMVGPTCPSCAATIPTDDLNIAEGVALCRACGKLARLGEVLPPAHAVEETRWNSVPPPGCRVDDDGSEIRITASARSLPAIAASLFFALFWNGVVSVFLMFVTLSLWTHLVGPLPPWMPNSFRGSGGPASAPLPMTISLAVFLIPFVAIGMYVFLISIVAMFGHVRVTLRGGDGEVLTGIGRLGHRRRFNALGVTAVRVIETNGGDSRTAHILIQSDTKLKFGSILTARRRAWLAGTLHALLLGGSATGGRATLPPVLSAGPPLPPP